MAKSTSRWIAWFLNNHVAANLLMFLFIIGGLLSATTMRTETFPSIDPRLITVSIPYPGATPHEVADGITRRVEQELLGIDGVKRITSSAQEGYGLISIELKDFSNADDVYNDVETAVNALSDFPPQDAERPVITKLRLTPNVLTLALHGHVSEDTLNHWAHTLEEELRQLPGVALTELRGLKDRHISIEVADSQLQQYRLSFDDIAAAITGFSQNIPAGTIESARGDVLLRIEEKRFTGEEFESIVLRSLPDGSTLTLGDIAVVVDGFQDTNLTARFNDEPAAFIDIKRSDTEDTLAIAHTVKAYLQEVALPKGLSLSLEQDQTVSLTDRISLMVRNALLGFMLVFLILVAFLDLRLAIWTAAAIPISFLGGLMIVNFLGFSLNMITLFALIVVLGIVVDDGIIMGESIFTAQDHEPDNPDSVLHGVEQVIAPVTVGVTTTMAAFLPLIFSTGTLGQIIRVIPVVVIAILLVSLVEAYFILPAHLRDGRRWSRGVMTRLREAVNRRLVHFLRDTVLPLANWLMRWRYATVAGFLGVLILTHALVSSGIIRFIFFPEVEADRIEITVALPVGTPFSDTTETVTRVENVVRALRENLIYDDTPSIESVSVLIGELAPRRGGPRAGSVMDKGTHMAQLTVKLVPSDFREYSSAAIERMIRDRIQGLPNVEHLSFKSSLIGDDPDIEIELSHPDDAVLEAASDALKAKLQSLPGTKNVDDSFELGKQEYVFELSPEGLAVGLTPSALGAQLRAAYFGLEVQRFQRGAHEVIVYIRYPKAEREQLGTLANTRIRLPNNREVPLHAVATIEETRGYSQIQTVNGRRYVSVTADTDPLLTTPNEVIAQLNSEAFSDLMAFYPGLDVSFEGESRDQKEDMASLLRNMMIALLLIYLLLGAQLRSYVQPLIIMSAIPFGVVGATLGHWILGYDLTFISMFGIVALMGVVINDSVVLVDYFNRQRKEGHPPVQSALRAVQRRFRPILLTTCSTCLGLLPMLLETSIQARFLIPMVVSLSMGILFGTLIILILVPCLVLVSEDLKALWAKRTASAHRD